MKPHNGLTKDGETMVFGIENLMRDHANMKIKFNENVAGEDWVSIDTTNEIVNDRMTYISSESIGYRLIPYTIYKYLLYRSLNDSTGKNVGQYIVLAPTTYPSTYQQLMDLVMTYSLLMRSNSPIKEILSAIGWNVTNPKFPLMNEVVKSTELFNKVFYCDFSEKALEKLKDLFDSHFPYTDFSIPQTPVQVGGIVYRKSLTKRSRYCIVSTESDSYWIVDDTHFSKQTLKSTDNKSDYIEPCDGMNPILLKK